MVETGFKDLSSDGMPNKNGGFVLILAFNEHDTIGMIMMLQIIIKVLTFWEQRPKV